MGSWHRHAATVLRFADAPSIDQCRLRRSARVHRVGECLRGTPETEKPPGGVPNALSPLALMLPSRQGGNSRAARAPDMPGPGIECRPPGRSPACRGRRRLLRSSNHQELRPRPRPLPVSCHDLDADTSGWDEGDGWYAEQEALFAPLTPPSFNLSSKSGSSNSRTHECARTLVRTA